MLSLTLATFLKAEWGFLGVMVLTMVMTPLLKELLLVIVVFLILLKLSRKATALIFLLFLDRPFLTSWLNVGMLVTLLVDLYPRE